MFFVCVCVLFMCCWYGPCDCLNVMPHFSEVFTTEITKKGQRKYYCTMDLWRAKKVYAHFLKPFLKFCRFEHVSSKFPLLQLELFKLLLVFFHTGMYLIHQWNGLYIPLLQCCREGRTSITLTDEPFLSVLTSNPVNFGWKIQLWHLYFQIIRSFDIIVLELWTTFETPFFYLPDNIRSQLH